MATGMINSQSQVTPQVLRSGETLATKPEALKDPNARTFHHMVPGARFTMPDGLEIRFLGGHFTTADPDIIAELEKVANKPTSMIFTQRAVAEAVTSQQKAAALDAGNTAGDLKTAK